jgi:hypothetical protein
MSHGLGANLMKIRGLGVLLVFSGVTLGALPAFAPTTTSITVHNNSTKPTPPVVFQPPPTPLHDSKAAPKPAKAPTKPVKVP